MLAQTIGDLLTFAVAISLSPIPIVGVVLMLSTPRAASNGPAFLLGWVVGLALVSWLIVFVVGSAGSDDGEPAAWVGLVQLALGVAVVALAAKQFAGRPRGDEPPPLPSWMAAVDTFTAAKAAGLGFALSAVNPKNLLLVLGAAATIAQSGLSDADELVAIGVFVVLATIGPTIPVAIYALGGDRATDVLANLKTWLARNNAVIMAVVLLLIGMKLVGQAIGALL